MQKKFKGIYSTPKGQRVWSGARLVPSAPTTTDKTYWIVWTGDKGKNVIHACTDSFETHGEMMPVAETDIQNSFEFEEGLTAKWANLEPVGESVFASKKTLQVNAGAADSAKGSGGQAVETKTSPIAAAKAASQIISTTAATQKTAEASVRPLVSPTSKKSSGAEAQTIQFGGKAGSDPLTIVKGSGVGEETTPAKKPAPVAPPVPTPAPKPPLAGTVDPGTPPAYDQQEKVMRTEFAMALARLRLGQREKAREQVETLLDKPGDFQPVHRHMFTEFGINLRKSKMPDLALRTHLKALDLGPKDSHVHFNAARACFDLGQYAEAKKHLDRALEIAPNLEPALRFLKYMNKNGKI